MKRKFAGLAAAAVTSALLLTSCAGGNGDNNGGSGDDNSGKTVTMWVIGPDTPQDARDFLTTKFKEETGATLKIQQQEWGDIITSLTTKLPDAKNTPDVTEIGNTQSPAFTNAGAFLDISDMYDELGGTDLLQSFVDVGAVDGKNYTLPYYFGSRYAFLRKDVWDAAGQNTSPKTLEEFNASVQAITEQNPKDIKNFSGFFLGGQDWRNGLSWIFANGGDVAQFKDGKWVATLDSPETQKGLEQLQDIYKTTSHAPNDMKDANQYQYLNDNDEVKDADGKVTEDLSLAAATIMAPGWAHWSIGDLVKNDEGDMVREWNDDTFATLVLPGHDGKPAPVFAGGSNIGISAKSQNPELAKDLLRIIYSEEYQTMLGKNGLGPANQKYASALGDDQFAKAAIESASNSKLTPAAPGWAAIESKNIMEGFFAQIRDSKDLKALALETNAELDKLLNQK